MPFKEEAYVTFAAPGALQRRYVRIAASRGVFSLEKLLVPFKEEVYVRIAASMLPTSTRTPGVCYTCAVAVRYDPLCVLLQDTQTWRIGTHTLGGVVFGFGRFGRLVCVFISISVHIVVSL